VQERPSNYDEVIRNVGDDMLNSPDPKWLIFLERRLRWLGIPNLAIILITFQAIGFFLVSVDPEWLSRLALIPELALSGEYWRVITFLALPISLHPVFVIFVLWFLYFIVNAIEGEWGDFKTTFYVLVSILVTEVYSFATGYPVTSVAALESSLFLAAAALFPDYEVRLFFAIPVKMKWLAWVTLGFLALQFVQGDWADRFFLLAIYSNYLVFFGPAHVERFRAMRRRARFRKQLNR